MDTKPIDGTRLLDSLASKFKGVVCTWEMCSKKINEIVLKVVKQKEGPLYAVPWEVLDRKQSGVIVDPLGRLSSLTLWKLKKMTKGQLVLDNQMHDRGSSVLSSAIPYLWSLASLSLSSPTYF